MTIDRRSFLQFLGASAVSLSSYSLLSSFTSCEDNVSLIKLDFKPSDELELLKGLEYKNIISWKDPINKKSNFGFNNDYINIFPQSDNELIMWVNHEYVHPLMVSGETRTKENIDIERKEVGGSLIKLKKENEDWVFIPNDPHNRRVDGESKIPFADGVKIRGKSIAEGTLGNCAGGKTPWNTVLTCEENYQDCYGERDFETGKVSRSYLDWQSVYPNPPEHYGWVVEINPLTGEAKKHINLGRMAHECATCIISPENKVVVYTGDDKNDEHLYKFISNSHDSFSKGILYVANIEKGVWLPVDLEKSPILKKHFKTHEDLMVQTRMASKILGATPLARPEDIEIHPHTKDVYITLTNNIPKKDFYGTILKITEDKNNHSSLSFKAETFLAGSPENGFACPDNLCFDSRGNLWFCSDISGKSMHKGPYESFGNNGLFFVPTGGKNAGNVIQVASAPFDAELTGICFSPDEKTLFLSVQHPGETSKSLDKLTSNWPDKKGLPRPSVVAIRGEMLQKLISNE